MIRRILAAAALGLAAVLLAGCGGGQSCNSAGQLQLERSALVVPAAPPAPAPRPAPAPAPRPAAPAPRQQAPAPARPAPAPAAPAPIIIHNDSGPSPWLWWWMLSQHDDDSSNGQQCRKDG